MSTVAAHDEPLAFERHGIDYIPPSERHGKPYTLFTFWAASNVQILAISVGVLAIVFGLSLPWAIFSIIVGNALGGLYMALHSAQGPRLGLPQMMQSRAQFGMYGTALVMCIGAIAAVVAKSAVSANAPDYLSGFFSAKWLFLIIILGVGSGNFGNL